MPNMLVLSDIHANLEALDAVFAHASQQHGRPDRIWCLGDIVGYGPDPGECIDRLRYRPAGMEGVPLDVVRGNHDEGVLQVDQHGGVDGASPDVRASWRWTAQELTPDQRRFLADLPTSYVYTDQQQSARLVHAAPPDNMEQYLLVAKDVDSALEGFEQRYCFFGHTHLACYFACSLEQRDVRPRLFPSQMDQPLVLRDEKVFLNPGAVGQPRWGRLGPWAPADQRAPADQPVYPLKYQGVCEASYLWVEIAADALRVWCHYVPYGHEQTITKLERLELAPGKRVPERWKLRLKEGLR